MKYKLQLVLAGVMWLTASDRTSAQAGRVDQGGGAPTAQAAAPIDLTGFWVSIVTEDWRFRMLTPGKGDYASVPLNAEAIKVADAWDPAKDEAAGNQCKSYGAAAIMRVPGRVHISWENESTLKIETDAGMQTRLFHFGRPQPPSAQPAVAGDDHGASFGSEVGKRQVEKAVQAVDNPLNVAASLEIDKRITGGGKQITCTDHVRASEHHDTIAIRVGRWLVNDPDRFAVI